MTTNSPPPQSRAILHQRYNAQCPFCSAKSLRSPRPRRFQSAQPLTEAYAAVCANCRQILAPRRQPPPFRRTLPIGGCQYLKNLATFSRRGQKRGSARQSWAADSTKQAPAGQALVRACKIGGGGNRTPVPKHFSLGLYMLSRPYLTALSPRQTGQQVIHAPSPAVSRPHAARRERVNQPAVSVGTG